MNTKQIGADSSHARFRARFRAMTAPAALLLIMLLVLSGCGGTDAGSADSPIVDSPTAAVATAVPQIEVAATEAAPSEVAPAEAIVPTDVPPTAVRAPTEEPAVTSSARALPEGLCANPYFPVIDDARYIYQTDIPDLGPSTSTFVFTNVTPTSFDMDLIIDDDNFITYTWQCLEDGILSPSAQFNNGLDMTVDTVEASGVTLPSPGNVQVGYTWPTTYVMDVTMADMGMGVMTTQQTVILVNEIIAIESVSTPYGDFDEAVKVQTTGTIDMVASMGDIALPAMKLDMSSNTWYVKNVGRVRSEDFSDLLSGEVTGPIITELLSIE